MGSRNIKTLLNENSALVMTGLFIITVILGYFLRLSPSLAKLNEVKASITNSEDSEKTKLKQVLESAKKNNVYFDSLDKDLTGKFYTALPTKKDVPVIYTEIDSLLRQSGVSLDGIDIVEIKASKGRKSESVEEDPNKPKEIAIGLKVRGSSWPMVKNFLANVESSLHLMDVLALSYNPKDNALSLNLKSYFLEEGKEE